MAKAFVGYHSTLTDVWTDIEFYSSGLILFTASLWTFLLECGRLSCHILALTKRLLVFNYPVAQW